MNLSTYCEYSPRYNNGILMVEPTDRHPFGELEQRAQYQVKRTQFVDEQLEHIPFEKLKMMHCKLWGSQMIENRSMDRLVKELLMMKLVMHTKKNDTVFHTEKTGMVILVVDIDVGGMTADVVDKLTCSSDDVQPKQVDLRCAHALTELHWHDIHVVPDRHEVDQHEKKTVSLTVRSDPTTRLWRKRELSPRFPSISLIAVVTGVGPLSGELSPRFPSISLIAIVTGVGPLSGKGPWPELKCDGTT
nr:hypothetical protein [Tanacetum cinerariifolium]